MKKNLKAIFLITIMLFLNSCGNITYEPLKSLDTINQHFNEIDYNNEHLLTVSLQIKNSKTLNYSFISDLDLDHTITTEINFDSFIMENKSEFTNLDDFVNEVFSDVDDYYSLIFIDINKSIELNNQTVRDIKSKIIANNTTQYDVNIYPNMVAKCLPFLANHFKITNDITNDLVITIIKSPSEVKINFSLLGVDIENQSFEIIFDYVYFKAVRVIT